MSPSPCSPFSALWSQTFLSAKVTILFLLLSTLSFCSIQATKVHYIHWNASNPIFRIDNTDHIFDVNGGNLPGEYDQANIICPVYKQGTASTDSEQYIIYNVSKEEYETCRITNPNPRVIAVCNKPSQVMYFTITFRSFTPTPGGMEFKPGQDYYFISTSSKSDLHRHVGGRCTTHNMKVMFKVADPNSKLGGGEADPSSSYYYPGSSSREVTQLLDSNGISTDLGAGPSGDGLAINDDKDSDIATSYENLSHRREVIKQEASRMQQDVSSAFLGWQPAQTTAVVLACLAAVSLWSKPTV